MSAPLLVREYPSKTQQELKDEIFGQSKAQMNEKGPGVKKGIGGAAVGVGIVSALVALGVIALVIAAKADGQLPDMMAAFGSTVIITGSVTGAVALTTLIAGGYLIHRGKKQEQENQEKGLQILRDNLTLVRA